MPQAANTLTPPLRDGDRLSSDEFMRRWEAMPDVDRAELIDGIVYMPSPVTNTHSDFDIVLATVLGNYMVATPGCRGGSKGTWLMSEGNVPQPDLTLRILPEYGGQSRIEGNYTAAAPELIAEIAVTSSAYDLRTKLKLYERMNVREYLVVLTGKSKLVWNVMTPQGYTAMSPDPNGIFRSPYFPGLWLDSKALWSGDNTSLFAVLQEGLASPEHAAFTLDLAARLTNP